MISEQDIFFDKDILNLWKQIRFCHGEPWWEVITDPQSGYSLLCNNSKRVFLTTLYGVHATSIEEYNVIKSVVKNFKKRFISATPYIEILVSSATINDFLIKEVNPDIRAKEWSSVLPPINNLVDLHNFNIKSVSSKSHRRNIKKAQKLGVKSRCYFRESIPNNIMQEFFEGCHISRKHVGKPFRHSKKTFITRRELVEKGKAILTKASYEDKFSYVYALVSKNNGHYLDSSYNVLNHPFTGHFAQYKLMLEMKKLGVNYYSLGKLPQRSKYIPKDPNQGKEISVEYYKHGFANIRVPELVLK